MQEKPQFSPKLKPFVLGISSDKGGVGKTFTTENLAYLLSKECKVLVIDMDSQGNLTNTYCSKARRNEVAGSETIFSDEPYLSFIPARIDGEDSETLFISVVNKRFAPALNDANNRAGVESLLKEAIEHTEHDFAVILIDTPPAPRSIQKNNTLAAANMILILVTDDTNSYSGAQDLVVTISKINENNPKILMVQNQYQAARKSLNRQADEWGKTAVTTIEKYKNAKAARIKPFDFILLEMKIPTAALASDAHNNALPVDIGAPKSSTNIGLKQLLTTIKEYM
jgi:cellulose biosynthesis protein BcsQ